VLIGVCLAFFIQKIDYRELAKKWIYIGIFCILLMLFTIFFGTNITGISGVNARAWIKIAGISFQSSELAKIGFILTFAKHLEILKKKNKINNFKSLVFLVLHVFLPVILSRLQGDDGAAIIFISIALCEAFMAGIDAKFFLWGITLFVLSVPLLWNFALAPYQKNRILNQFNPESDPLGIGFQQIQSKLSIGSGGLFGKGIFCGRRVTDGAVPVQESDFIFSVSGEEIGFLGCILILLLMASLIFVILKAADNVHDFLGSNICFGFLGIVMSQCIFNIGMCLSLLPVIGVTLPFFSAGGSSVACLYIGFGLIQSVFSNLKYR
jgi:rod shape determining protein RodA